MTVSANNEALAGPAPGSPERYVGTAVNPQTLLATDYLNHFNEAIMLLEMLPDMPDCLEDLNEWSPKSYVQHFEEARFHTNDLCIEAYAFVEPNTKKKFENVIAALDRNVEKAIAAGERGDMQALGAETAFLRALIDKASGIINGTSATSGDFGDKDHIEVTSATVDAIFS